MKSVCHDCRLLCPNSIFLRLSVFWGVEGHVGFKKSSCKHWNNTWTKQQGWYHLHETTNSSPRWSLWRAPGVTLLVGKWRGHVVWVKGGSTGCHKRPVKRADSSISKFAWVLRTTPSSGSDCVACTRLYLVKPPSSFGTHSHERPDRRRQEKLRAGGARPQWIEARHLEALPTLEPPLELTQKRNTRQMPTQTLGTLEILTSP